MTRPPELRLRPIEGRLGSSLSRWKDLVAQTQRSVARPDFNPKQHGPGHAGQLAQVIAEIETAEADLHSLEEVSRAAKAEAEYRAIVVGAWPRNAFLDRLSFLGAAILGAGGAAYLFVGSLVTVFFWVVGGVMMAYALVGIRQHELKRWRFFQDQFNIDERYRPDLRNRVS